MKIQLHMHKYTRNRPNALFKQLIGYVHRCMSQGEQKIIAPPKFQNLEKNQKFWAMTRQYLTKIRTFQKVTGNIWVKIRIFQQQQGHI